MHIGKQYAYMLGAYDARIVFLCFSKQFNCVDNSHFSTIDYFSVKAAPVVKLIQSYLCEKEVNFSYDTFQTCVTHRVYNQSVVVKRSSIQSDTTPNSNIHRHKLLREF